MITYRKTRNDEWVVFGPVDEVVPGSEVSVHTKDGRIVQEYVVRIGTPFDVDGVPHVYGYLHPDFRDKELADKAISKAVKRPEQGSSDLRDFLLDLARWEYQYNDCLLRWERRELADWLERYPDFARIREFVRQHPPGEQPSEQAAAAWEQLKAELLEREHTVDSNG